MLCKENLSYCLTLVTGHISPWAMYASCYKAVFLCLHSKGSKMSYGTAAKYMKLSKIFISKLVKCYSDVKNVNYNLPDRNSVQKPTKKYRKILRVFEKNSHLSLRIGQTILYKKNKYIMWHYKKMFTSSWSEILKHSEETAVQKNTSKKDSLKRKKIWNVIRTK